MGAFIDMTNWIMKEHGVPDSKWTVIEYKSKSMWLCQCECGTIRTVKGYDLRKGKSKNCGCVRKEKTTQRNKENAKDISHKMFGYLEALYPTEERRSTYVVWVCKCHNCGNLHRASLHDLVKGNIKSCGCMVESQGELEIKQLLQQNNIIFETEKTFETCVNPDTGCHFYFDFWVNNSYIIEYDGSQHFSPMKYNNCGWNSQENFEKTVKHDNFKNDWCYKNNIPIIRIPYTLKGKIKYEDIDINTSKYIKKI